VSIHKNEFEYGMTGFLSAASCLL